MELLLLRQEIDHRVGGLRVNLGGIRALETENIPCILDNCELEAVADPEERLLVHAGIVHGAYLPLRPPRPEAREYHDAIVSAELLNLRRILLKLGRLDPIRRYTAADFGSSVLQGSVMLTYESESFVYFPHMAIFSGVEPS